MGIYERGIGTVTPSGEVTLSGKGEGPALLPDRSHAFPPEILAVASLPKPRRRASVRAYPRVYPNPADIG